MRRTIAEDGNAAAAAGTLVALWVRWMFAASGDDLS
jgi:hypothetical protein